MHNDLPETTSPATAARLECEAHTDLNTLAAVVTLLKGGHIYTLRARATAARVIKLAQAEQQHQLRAYDKALRMVARNG